MFPGASDEHWSLLTQVSIGVGSRRCQEELDRGVSVEDMTHEPLGFLSGAFKRVTAALGDGGQGRLRRGDYFQAVGVPFVERRAHIYTDHRTLAYIFDPLLRRRRRSV